MKQISTRFFLTGAIFALAGMAWGIQMSATHNHTLSPAHGHLNLIGFVMMTLFGVYYALSPAAAASRLARLHHAMMVATVLVLVPGIALAIQGTTEVPAQIGSILAVLSMALFVYVVARYGVGAGATPEVRDAGASVRVQAAE
jgi:peptidoglycan/LPS O-acetylase OafA/YrhL